MFGAKTQKSIKSWKEEVKRTEQAGVPLQLKLFGFFLLFLVTIMLGIFIILLILLFHHFYSGGFLLHD